MARFTTTLFALSALTVLPSCDEIAGKVGGDKEEKTAEADKDAEKSKDKDKAQDKDKDKEADKADDKEEAEEEKEEAKEEEDEEKEEEEEDEEAEEDEEDDDKPGLIGGLLAGSKDAAPAPAGDNACIVGNWEGVEYMAAIRKALRENPQLKGLKKTSKTGFVGYIIQPPTDGKGQVTAKADDLRYNLRGKVEGIKVRVSVRLNGETEAEYELKGDDQIIIDEPTKDTMKIKATAKVEGFGRFGKSPKIGHEFTGSFVYECNGDDLKVWRDKKGNGDPRTFKRKDEV